MSSSYANDTEADLLKPRTIPEEQRCKYNQTICYRERATKVNGGRHQLCIYHRNNANAAQRRFAKRTREERRRKKKKTIEKGDEAENLLDLMGIHSKLSFELSDLIPLDESVDEGLQLEYVLSSENDFEWLKEVLLESKSC